MALKTVMNQSSLDTNKNWIYAVSVYATALFFCLFLYNFSLTPKLYDDSWDYINISENMDCISCFWSPSLPDESDLSFRDYITKTTKGGEYYDTCFFRLNRPFLYPLLIKIFGSVEILNIFQNVARSAAWTLLAMAIFYLGFNKIASLTLHASILFIGLSPIITKYQNTILTEDLNLSFWLLQIILLIMLTKSEARKRVAFVLALITICNFLIIFLRDSNLISSVLFIIFVYGYVLFSRKHRHAQIKYKAFLAVVLIINLSFAVFSYLSISKSGRYLHTVSNQIIFHLGGDFNPWPKEEFPHLYEHDHRDSTWFYINYPELKSINPPAERWASINHPFIRWEIDKGKQAWFKYVITHLDDFMILMLKHLGDFMALMLKPINYGLISSLKFTPNLFWVTNVFAGGIFATFILSCFMFQEEKRTQIIFIWLSLSLIVFINFFIALVGDFPGELYRHVNLSMTLLAILLSFSMVSIFDSFVELFSGKVPKLAITHSLGLNIQ